MRHVGVTAELWGGLVQLLSLQGLIITHISIEEGGKEGIVVGIGA